MTGITSTSWTIVVFDICRSSRSRKIRYRFHLFTIYIYIYILYYTFILTLSVVRWAMLSQAVGNKTRFSKNMRIYIHMLCVWIIVGPTRSNFKKVTATECHTRLSQTRFANIRALDSSVKPPSRRESKSPLLELSISKPGLTGLALRWQTSLAQCQGECTRNPNAEYHGISMNTRMNTPM